MIKKRLVALGLMVGLLSQSMPMMADYVVGEKLIGIHINGKSLFDYTDGKDVRPIMKNNRVLTPLRVISENLNSTVDWNQQTKTVTIDDNETKDRYVFKIGQKSFTKNGTPITIDQAAIVTASGKTVVPIRAIGQMYGKVDWDQKNWNVLITTERKVTLPENDPSIPAWKRPHPKKVQEGLEASTYIGASQEALAKYIKDEGTASIVNDNRKTYYSDSSTFLSLDIFKYLGKYHASGKWNDRICVPYYIDDNGILQGWGKGFSSTEELNKTIKYVLLSGNMNGELAYHVIRVSETIPLRPEYMQ